MGPHQRIYQLQPKPFEELDTWVETFRKAWEDRLDKLDDYLKELKAAQPPDDAPVQKP